MLTPVIGGATSDRSVALPAQAKGRQPRSKAVVMGMRLGASPRRRALIIVRAQRVKEKEFTVNKIWIVILIAASTSAIAQQQPVTRVQTALNHLTVIEVAEPITMAAAGSEAFEIERHGTRVFVKPTKPDVATNLFRDIYLTPPDPMGSGLIKVANGAGSTWTACCAKR